MKANSHPSQKIISKSLKGNLPNREILHVDSLPKIIHNPIQDYENIL